MTNEQTFINHIRKQGFKTLNTEWVCWALEKIGKANDENKIINPDWLAARMVFESDNEPPMTK